MQYVDYKKPNYYFDADHKYAHYYYNDRYMNGGDFKETTFAEFMTGKSHAKDNISFEKDSDLNYKGNHYSIKSFGASLTSIIYATENTKEEKKRVIKEYMRRVHSNKFVYIVDLNEEYYRAYIMGKREFKKFLETKWIFNRMSFGNTGGKLKLVLKINVTDTQARKTLEKIGGFTEF